MAFWWVSLNVHNSNWTSSINTSSASTTFQNVLDALKTWQWTGWADFNQWSVRWTWQEIWLSLTEWWTPLTLSSLVTSIFPEETSWTLYALYPEPETITGFFLDWTEYKFEWWWTAEWITTTQPSNPVAGSTYYDITNKVVKVYNWTAWEEVGWGNVIAMTQAEYDALPAATKNDGKLRIITDATSITLVDDTAFGSSWDGETSKAPSKNAVYDAIWNIETLLAAI